MSNEDELLVQESTATNISGVDRSHPTARPAYFLLPCADATRLLVLPSPRRSGGPFLHGEIRVEWRGWPSSSKLSRRWVTKLRPLHEGKRVGIFDAILSTTWRIRRDEDLLLQLAAFWSRETSTFVLQWGEATVTLEDVAVLGGLPLLGKPVCAVLPDALRGDVHALEGIRSALNRSKSKKPNYSSWVNYFLECPPESDAGGGRGDTAAGLLEHGAFLAMWLSEYVLPSPPCDVVQARVLPIAAQLARGQPVALAPAALASIYKCLSTLAGCAPLQILQLWVWERFPELRPEKVSAHNNDNGVPARAAKWHNVREVLEPRCIHAVFMSPGRFEWMPYGSSSSFGVPPSNGGRRVHGQDIARSDELLSMALCLHPCELVGVDCIEQYCPHRVARQLGFDQDVPGDVCRVNSDPVAAWSTYKIEARSFAFIFPNRDAGVTVEYARWWEPYSSACAAHVANAARTNELVHPSKRKMEGAVVVDMQSTPEDIVAINNNESLEESEKDVEVAAMHLKSPEPVNENVEVAERVVCARTLYYLRPFEQAKYGQAGASRRNSDQEFFSAKTGSGDDGND
ncbi:hypothetical protein CFC21_020438 [Triticum aestivum]|uniref:Aminotransferase-like plant mobile domain-containing protein n=2 Tax=Triticum aestivum TaxID=4565 RepID=A0A3B6NJG8_WHEAT|nr:protein MAIN-LIKE 2-like [Triticum aestivum]KAF7005312.1 hypothetical protein CFC21_020438 [Triticum aestivum]